MELIQKIKAEIERRYNYEKEMYCDTKPDGRPNDGWAESLAIMGVLEELLSFLSTLESEKPVPKDLEQAANEYAYRGIPDEMKPYVKPVGDEVIKNFIAGAKWDREQMMKEAVKWLVDDDYFPQTDKGRFILGSAGIGYNGYYIPYSDLLKLPKEDEK